MRAIAEKAVADGLEPLVLAHRRELLKQIAADLKGVLPADRVQSVFTVARHLDRLHADLIIIDEAHLSQANSYLKVIEAAGCPVVGLTATPTRLDGQPLSSYTSIVQGVSADELIEQGYLAPYDLYAPTLYDVSGIKPAGADYSASELEGIVLRSELYGDVIEHYKRLADGKQAIAYCSTTTHSLHVARAFCEAGIPAMHIDANSPNAIREEALEALRSGSIRVLCNVNLISEGISIPECSVVLGLRPTQSRALYIQQACRALRYAPGKRATIIDFAGNVHRHGWPTEDYRYELGVPAKARKEITDDGDLVVRICSKCFRTYSNTQAACPYCGTVYEPTPREIKAKQDIHLQAVKEEEIKAEMARKRAMRRDTHMAKTFEDLQAIAQRNGYSKRWCFVQARIRNIPLR